jgi:cardiolipin synthase
MSAQAKEKFLNLPNILTLVRFALAPVFAVMVLQNQPFGALWVVVLAAVTDVLDGFVARLLRLSTGIGTLIDPLADKFLGATAYVLLSLKGLGAANVIPLWVTATVLGRDLVILAGGLVISLARGRQEFRPTVYGKASTVLQVATVFWVILANCVQASAWRLRPALAAATSPRVLSWFYAVTIALTLISGVHYVVRGVGLMSSGKK